MNEAQMMIAILKVMIAGKQDELSNIISTIQDWEQQIKELEENE